MNKQLKYYFNPFRGIFPKRKSNLEKGIEDAEKGKFLTHEEVFKEKKWEWYHQIWWFLRYGLWSWIGERPLRIRSFLQRGYRGWSHADTWYFCYYLAKVIKEGLINLKKYQHGHPGDLAEEEWNTALDKIIKTFDTAMKIIDSGELIYLPTKNWDTNKRKRWVRIINETNKKLGCKDGVMTKKECKEYEEGWRLFQEYFFDLWD